MYLNTKEKKEFNRVADYKQQSHSNNSLYDYDLCKRIKSSGFHINETKNGYHFELRINGYVKDDFAVYFNENKLIITTKSDEKKLNETPNNTLQKHSYCYASDFFKKTIQLPKDILKDDICIDYQNHILSFDLLKSESN